MAFSNLEKAMAAIIGIDIVAPGMSRAAAKAAVSLAARTFAGATTPALATTAPFFPAAAGAALGGAVLQSAPGQELLALAEERGRQDRLRLERFVQDTLAIRAEKKKRKKSKFNQAVGAGMKAAKASKFYGKKGTLTNSKAAFAAVTKIASKLRRGLKVSRTGSSGVIARAMPKWGKGPRSGR